jgi:acyl-CoA thioesterase
VANSATTSTPINAQMMIIGAPPFVATVLHMPNRFSADTAVVTQGDGRYSARIDPGWWIERGPNGGYVAAVILRAVTVEVAAPERRLRSFTVHYLAPPTEGAVEVLVTVERQGRSLTSVSARLVQADRLVAIAVGAFSISRPSIEFCDLVMPDVAAPEDLPSLDPSLGPLLRRRYEERWALGPMPFSGGDVARAGGWIRLARSESGRRFGGPESETLDQHLLVALADAWMPPIFGRLTEPLGVPTIDLTVHLRDPIPPGYDDWVLVDFHTSVASDRFVEVDGELWTRDGRLLAQSRQLALALV